ncbi:cell adhesion molecule-related/down-regulated by oncogenes-like isoform X2 [Eriocheir sinensis]|uniref:cell adhesion molecule-related/down-regulated by oncogenes-like isoform X2 n=1 Tax=Eriocheir sinensis TaxID=95602 RepID=UPI0021C9C3AE|nr:cell adhesion molecule-related/down-regulated by oncogenes-like isoform X2 [Eriocheir sinensis]
MAVILWYRDNHPDAMYTYDARNTSLGYRQHNPRDQDLARRTKFFPQPPARMVVSGASLDDAGRYECRVDFMRAPSKTTIIQVTVVEPPSSIRVALHTGKTVTSNTVTADEGSPLRLSCIVTGGHPRPRVWWTLHNKTHEFVVDETYEAINGDLTQNDLMLPRLTPDHHMTGLACHASNTNATGPITSRVTLLLNMAPQRVRITGLEEPLLAGHRYRVGCETFGSRPAPVLKWSIKRPDRLDEILAKQDLSKRNVSRSFLELDVDWSDHKATLKCSAASPALPERSITNSSVFEVNFAPRLHLTLGTTLQPDGIKEEMDVYFQCTVKANPWVYKISWYHNDVEVENNRAGGVLASDDHLVLQRITRRWSGTYLCKASNVVGDAVSNALHIPVQYAPICASSSTTVFRAALGEEIVIPCRVLSHPPNVTFSWTFMNALTEHERVPGDRVSWRGLVSRLRYLPEKTQDYGTLHCWASNRVGNQEKPCIFHVKPAGVPSPPLNCTVSNQTWESVEVTCGDSRAAPNHHRTHSYGYDSELNEVAPANHPAELLQDSDKPRYLLTVKERLTHAVTHNLTGERGVFSVTGLTAGLDYVISVVRYNSHGRSSNVTLEAFTLRTAENRMREELEGGESALLGVVLGVMGVVLLLAVGAIAVTLRSRSRPRPSSPSKKTRLPPGEASESGTLDHPDLLEAESHVPTAGPYRSAEVTQALLSPARTLDDEVSITPASVSPSAHLDYLPCEGTESVSPSVRSHPRLYVRAEGHTGQQESFL